jgi:hypothetical protein
MMTSEEKSRGLAESIFRLIEDHNG